MDGKRFDQLTRAVASKTTRRGILKGLFAAAASTAIGRKVPIDVGWAAPAAPETAPGRYQSSNSIQYYALGDSVASGHGLGADCVDTCLRSYRAYPFRLAAFLQNDGYSVETHHFACSGATSSGSISAAQREKTLGFQVEEVLKDLPPNDPPTLVTITIGANDFHWLEQDFLQKLTAQSDAAFESELTNISKQIRTNVISQVNKLLDANPNLGIVITDYYNPFDPTTLFGESWIDLVNPMRLAQTWSWWFPTKATKNYLQARYFGLPLVDTVLGATLGIELKAELYQIVARMDRVISAVNGALSLVSKNSTDPRRVQKTSTIRQAFSIHPATCLFPLDGATTWIQNPLALESNSVRCVSKIDALQGFGDCIHPNATGAESIAAESLNPTLRMLAILGSSPNGLQAPAQSTSLCDGQLCDGQCVDTGTSSANCGQCGRVCSSGQCVNGRCIDGIANTTCREPRVLCGATCRNLQTNRLHCGECGNNCHENACIDGVCQDTPGECGSNQSMCAEACVDLSSDHENCGECGRVCLGSTCVQGDCLADYVCTSDSDCPTGSCCEDICVDSLNDIMNCGSCGTICGEDQVCESGNCTYLPAESTGTLVIETYDANTSQPVLGARYFVYIPGTLGYGMTDSDSSDHSTGGLVDGATDGLTIIADMDPGTYSVSFMNSWLHPANQYHQSDYADFADVHWDAIEIIAGETAHLAVHLPGPSSAIEVHWVDDGGNPVPERYCSTDGPGLWANVGPVDDTNIWRVSSGGGYAWSFPLSSTAPCVFHLGPFGAGEVALSFYDWSTGSAELIHSDNVTLNFGEITSVDAVVPGYCTPGRTCSHDAECCLRLDEICDEGICAQPVNISSSPEPCPDRLVSCDGACTDLGTSIQHCGSCGNSCQEGRECQEGVCDEQESETPSREENPPIEESPLAPLQPEIPIEIEIEPTATPADAVDVPIETLEPDVEPTATPLS